MELLGSQGLVQLAWMHRWMFAENLSFVKMDFGRSFKPQGGDEELLKYGNLIADRMMSYGLPESTPELRASLDEQYIALLRLYEAHLTDHPYLLGGHPSAADYAMMGALHAHMGRDPAGLRVMQDHGPRTFRWMDHMLVPEVQSPEFFSRPVDYPDADQIPETALAILCWIADAFGEPFVWGAKAFNQAMSRQGVTSGHELAPEEDQPTLAAEQVSWQGAQHQHKTNLYSVWLGQRAQRCFQAQTDEVQQGILNRLDNDVLNDLLREPVRFPLARVNNRLVIE